RRREKRFDEDADGNQAVGEYDVRDALPTPAKLAPALHDLLEAGRHARDDPARILRYDITGKVFEDLPIARNDGPRGLDHRVVNARVHREIGERELFDALAALVQHARLQQQSGRTIGPEAMTVAQAVLRLEHHHLDRTPAHAIVSHDPKVVVTRKR